MARNLTEKGVLNAVARGLEYVARVVVAFFLNPLLVGGLGTFGFGAWQVLLRLIGYAAPTSGRPGHALRWVIASLQGSSDFDEKRGQVGSAGVVWLIFLPVTLVLGAPLAWFAPTWLEAPETWVWPVRAAAFLLVVNLAVGSLAELPRSTLEGENLGYRRMGWSAGFVMFSGLLVAVAVWLDTGIVGVAGATVAGSIATGLFFLLVTRTYVPWFGVKRPPKGTVRKFLGLSGWFLGWNAVTKLMRASDVVILGFFASVELVTDYTLSKYVPEALTSMVGIMVFAVTPGLGGIVGSGDKKKAVKVRAEIMTFSWLLLCAGGATVLAWNEAFVTQWVGERFNVGPGATVMIVLMVGQYVLLRNDANIIDLTLKLRSKVIVGLISAFLSIALSVAILKFTDMGVVGLCLGFILGRSVLSVAYPWLVGRYLEQPLIRQIQGLVRPLFVTVGLYALAIMCRAPGGSVGWIGLTVGVSVTGSVALLLSFGLGLQSEARRQLIRRIRLAAAIGGIE